MSLDASLKAANALVRHRNVLTRDERLAKLKEAEKWDDGKGVFGLPKVAHRKQTVGGKGAKEETAEGTAGAAVAGAAPAAAAAPAKGAAAPAKGAAPGKPGAASGAAAAPAKGKK